MIDWKTIDKKSPLAWTALADQLIAKSQFHAGRDPVDATGIDAVVQDMKDFVEKANTVCPVEAIEAIRRASNCLTQLAALATEQDLKVRSAKLDSLSARLSSASNELKAEAALLRLEPVRSAINLAGTLVAKVKAVEAEVATLSKNDMASRISEILKGAEDVFGQLETSLSS